MAWQIRGSADQGCLKLVNHNVAADVSRLKLENFCSFSQAREENNDPAHAGCYEIGGLDSALTGGL
jgi:hypothetical protein